MIDLNTTVLLYMLLIKGNHRFLTSRVEERIHKLPDKRSVCYSLRDKDWFLSELISNTPCRPIIISNQVNQGDRYIDR